MIVIKHPSDLLMVDIQPAYKRLIQDCFCLIRDTYGDAYAPEIDGYIVYL